MVLLLLVSIFIGPRLMSESIFTLERPMSDFKIRRDSLRAQLLRSESKVEIEGHSQQQKIEEQYKQYEIFVTGLNLIKNPNQISATHDCDIWPTLLINVFFKKQKTYWCSGHKLAQQTSQSSIIQQHVPKLHFQSDKINIIQDILKQSNLKESLASNKLSRNPQQPNKMQIISTTDIKEIMRMTQESSARVLKSERYGKRVIINASSLSKVRKDFNIQFHH